MGDISYCCPMCKNTDSWVKVEETNKGYNTREAAKSFILFGAIGLAAGVVGNHVITYCCGKCGFKHEYNVDVHPKGNDNNTENHGNKVSLYDRLSAINNDCSISKKWTCRQCGTLNDNTAVICKDCGEYK